MVILEQTNTSRRTRKKNNDQKIDEDWFDVVVRAILADTNNYVNFIDFKVLNLITGEIKTYNSIDTGIDKEEVAYQTEFLNLLDFPGTPLHVLKLKIDVSIILLQNFVTV
ncbi:putative PIF1-like helicase [Hamiltosporidium tvaerminnensis]|uniref:Putative PIF1-like helicase n=1 Tax=Hamiltosporidium tvaerminnensis TaxID=1176355 RepID=A0A4Q9LQ84_9MICR|nr:putative PIF1-like helicase [Hamiltosporidium tvaerminnensis]